MPKNNLLHQSGVKLDLITNYDMFMMVENGIRGGLTQVAQRKAVAGPTPTDLIKFLLYLDANNLYGWAMMEFLPTGEFEYYKDAQQVAVVMAQMGPVETWARDAPRGGFLEVSLRYPLELHDAHNDLPFLCEKKIPPGGGRVQKLLCTLDDKVKYVVHYRALQQAIAHGLVVTDIHRVITFAQSPWMRDYIIANTERRKRATNKAESDAQKLYNNAAYGKTMENLRSRTCIDLVTDQQKLMKLIASARFMDRTILTDKLVAVHRCFREITMNKPIYVGLAVLDISKTLMYEFHYDKMVPWFGRENVSVMYMDTDSFVYEIKSKDLVQDLLLHKDEFDFSNYPEGHPLRNVQNDKVPGFMKDELAGKAMEKFFAVRSKAYAAEIEGGGEIKRAKGVGRAAVRNKITTRDYERVVEEDIRVMTSFNRIQSNEHNIATVAQRKLALCAKDDKRHLRADGIHTYAHGHFRIGLELMDEEEDEEAMVE